MAMRSLFPFCLRNNIPVVFGTDETFAPYTAVALASLAQTAQPQYGYDIWVVCGKELPLKDKKRLCAAAGKNNNISVRFLSLSRHADAWTKQWRVRENYSPAIYYRLLLPQLLKHYDKIIYADADVLFLQGVEKLFFHPLPQGKLLGGVPDCLPYGGGETARRLFLQYVRRIGLKNPFSYINAGILLWDLKNTREQKMHKRLLRTLAELKDPLFPDQDTLNIVFQERMELLPFIYNFFAREPDISAACPSKEAHYLQARREASSRPAIVHFASFVKPWFYPNIPYAKEWWRTARRTPFAQDIEFSLRRHDQQMHRRRQRRWFYRAQIYAYKALNKLPVIEVQGAIARLSERQQMNDFWAKYRFENHQEGL